MVEFGQLPTVDIVLGVQLEDIPEGQPCMFCDHPTERVFLEHVCYGSKVKVRGQVAGYRCTSCHTNYFSPEGLIESLGKACDVMREYGDQETAASFEKCIQSIKRAVGRIVLVEW